MNTALVTGAAGFVGRHMVAELERRNYRVDRVDIADGSDAMDTFRGEDPWRYGLVVHAAARSPHRAAIDGQPEMFPYNTMLDAAMFAWAIRTGQPHVLYLSSSAVYPISYQQDIKHPRRLKEQMVDEMRVLAPDASYGWTKFHGEQMAAAARAARVLVTVVRPFSGYGTDQSEDFPFGAFLGRARRHEDPFGVWNANAVRDWIHIDDVVAGALAAVDAKLDQPINLCTGTGTSMQDLIAMLSEAAGYRPALERHPDKPSGVAYRVGDPTWLHEYYTPKISLEEGVKRALADG